MQVIQLSERLEEAEGGAESQVSIKMNHSNEMLQILKFDSSSDFRAVSTDLQIFVL